MLCVWFMIPSCGMSSYEFLKKVDSTSWSPRLNDRSYKKDGVLYLVLPEGVYP